MEKNIRNGIERLQKHGRIYTNDYSKNYKYDMEQSEVYCTDKSMILIQPDHGVDRLLYYTVEWKDLSDSIRKVGRQELVVEFLTKDEKENRDLFQELGFEQLAKMQRFANYDCRKILQQEEAQKLLSYRIGHSAESSEAHEINQKLWEIFDTRISHLLTDLEIETVIRKGGIIIERSIDGVISTILQFDMQPKKFYINQIYNENKSQVLHSILLNQLSKYCKKGGKYLYSWIESGNIASQKFHRKYGMEPDGMYDMIYIRKSMKKSEENKITRM